MAERPRDTAAEVAEADRIRAYFDRDAERFDRIYAGANRSPVQRLVDRLFRSAMLRRRADAICSFVDEGETCLEVGSGSGRIAVPLALKRRARVIGVELAPAALRQMRDAAAGIVRMRNGLHEPLLLEPAQEPAHQSGVEPEIVADRGDVAMTVADGVENARGAERPAAAEERGIERADFRRHGAVEAAHPGDGVRRHIF